MTCDYQKFGNNVSYIMDRSNGTLSSIETKDMICIYIILVYVFLLNVFVNNL